MIIYLFCLGLQFLFKETIFYLIQIILKITIFVFFAVPCPDPTPDNGYNVILEYNTPPPNNESFSAYTILQFGCNSGYTLIGTFNISICLPDGVWALPVPNCIIQGSVNYSITLMISY